jgi:hypothetical protein
MEKKNTVKARQFNSGDSYEIPVEGSLGLLALGWQGLKRWREKRNEVMLSVKSNKKDDTNG